MIEEKKRVRPAVGRPPKFAGPSRVVTVTLPEQTLADLARINADRARAIVEATRIATEVAKSQPILPPTDHVDVQKVAGDAALITVPFSPSLSAISGLTLIEFGRSRYLVIVEPDTSLSDIEVSVLDSIDQLASGADEERAILESLLVKLRGFRRSSRARTASVILIDPREVPA